MNTITTKFFGPSGKRGSRIIARSCGTYSATYECRDDSPRGHNHYMSALKLCQKMDWRGVMHEGDLRPGEKVFVFQQDGQRLTWKRGGSPFTKYHRLSLPET